MVTVAGVRLLGGHPALDFVNTVENRAAGGQELLGEYRDLLTWARRSGLVAPATGEALARRAQASEREAAAVLRRAVDFREALHAVLVAVLSGQPPRRAVLDAVNREVGAAYARSRLLPAAGAFALLAPSAGLSSPLQLVARQAVGLLTGSQLDRVRRCEGAGDCGWFFLDATRNGRRRWCSMAGCGSRVKMRRQYARRKLGSGTEPPP